MMGKTLESPLDCKEIQPVHSKGDQPCVFFGRTDAKAETSTLATSCEELTHWKRLWCWEGLGAGGEGDDGGWDGWMASLTWWTWVSVNSGSLWWTGRPGVLRFIGSQKLDTTERLIWSDLIFYFEFSGKSCLLILPSKYILDLITSHHPHYHSGPNLLLEYSTAFQRASRSFSFSLPYAKSFI